MAQIITKIKDFSLGMTNNPRDIRENVCRLIKHFNNYSLPKLTPHRSLELDAVSEDTLDTMRIQKMLNASGKIYGSGVVSDTDAHTQIYIKATEPTDPTKTWTTATNGTSASSVATAILFVYYQKYIYGSNNAGIWRYGDITGTPSFTYDYYTTYIPTAQGLVHSDSIFYVPSNNLILKESGSGFSVALTLPVGSSISSLCEYGNYLAIACNMPDGSAVVYLWDRNSSLSDISEKIDWGFGTLALIESIGGVLVGISSSGLTITSLAPTLYFKYWTGSQVLTFEKFSCSYINIINDKQKFNELFYFLAEITIGGNLLYGLWKIYKNSTGQLSVSFDVLPRNDTLFTSSGKLKGFLRIGDYILISYIKQSDSKYTVWRTDDQATYSATSIWESVIYNFGDSSQKKKLKKVTVMHEPLTVNAQVVLEYKIDSDSDWTPIFTHNTANSISHSAINIESSGVPLPEFKELQLRIESTNGCAITAIKIKVETLDKDISD